MEIGVFMSCDARGLVDQVWQREIVWWEQRIFYKNEHAFVVGCQVGGAICYGDAFVIDSDDPVRLNEAG